MQQLHVYTYLKLCEFLCLHYDSGFVDEAGVRFEWIY